jgi:site-specific recombinase XerD
LGGTTGVSGGFDSHALPPALTTLSKKRERRSINYLTLNTLCNTELIDKFVKSRRDGLSPRTLDNYRLYLKLANEVVGLDVTGQDIQRFITSRGCTDGGKHAYYRCLRAFYNWLYSPKSMLGLSVQDNPILAVEAPKVGKKILPNLTNEQLGHVIDQASCVRDKAIISLFADSGLRLTELTNINPNNIDWSNRLIKVRCKGNKEGYAPFGERTESLLREWLGTYKANGLLWDINRWSIVDMLRRLEAKTGLRCNAHTFRRTFASILAKRGVDSLHIMRLGRWESIQMVERYTRSVKFEDSLKLYSSIVG